ncbi:AraC family transcriptional regulator [Clostridium grantii]|uniref:AraC-type DNA-binding protein n=1 Tax=Clostridium grantii DSM 8605 TaxID=1121316 RepID=A0A1M5TQ27_9CLOT|nr:AraC family transcriptional regulator [Clostridium grantii]SHH52778.1 AraC-type DNA-binding protein [Clostridium grantii DSM 8605]
MENRVDIYPKELPIVATVGMVNVTTPWRHLDRILEINTMLFVLNGTVHVSENGVDYEVNKNQVFFLKNRLHHYGKTLTQPGAKWFWISFIPSTTPICADTMYLPKLLTISSPDKMHDIIAPMKKLYNSSEPFKAQRLSGSLYQIFFQLLSQPSKYEVNNAAAIITPKVIKMLKSQIKDKFSAKLIEDKLNMSYSYLGRLFKSETGTTINRYHMELKVREVINLMQTTNLTLSEISDKLNYPNPYYLSRIFKKVVGMSPRDYQHQLYH